MSDPEVIARDEFFDSLLGDFLDESGQLLDRLNENLLQLDEWVRSLDENHHQRCDDELMNEMFRSAHSLKGLSAMLGLADINRLTHKVENVFDAARKDELIIDGEVVELMFQAADRLVGLVGALKEPEAEAVECGAVIESIGRMLESSGAARQQTSQEDAERALQEMSDPGQTASGTEPDREGEIDFFSGLEDESEAPAKYLSIFIDETELSLDQLTETLLALEGGGGSETVEKLLVTSHRIKGSAASIGLKRPAKLAHLMEDLLQNLVDTGRALWPEVTDAMLKCTDALRQYLEGLKHGGPRSDQFNQMAHELLAAQAPTQPSGQPQPPAATAQEKPSAVSEEPMQATAGITDELRDRVRAAADDDTRAFVGTVSFQPDLALVGLKARLLFEKLSNLGEVCCFDPPADSLDELEDLEGISFGLTTEKSLEAVKRPLRIAGVQQAIVEPLVSAGPAPPTAEEPTPPGQQAASATGPVTPAEKRQALEPSQPVGPTRARPADSATRPAETLRVDIERLDQLMNLAGQLVINKARFSQIADRLKTVMAGKRSSQVLGKVLGTLERMTTKGAEQGRETNLQAEVENLRGQARRVQNDLETVRRDVEMLTQVRASINDLSETIHQLDRVTDGIQQSVMDTRMLPIGPLFARFKRVIRDITRANGKDIRLEIRGEKTELDKRMIDELGDPLIHMVRNSADHGIELPEVREAAGKPRQGMVTLDAFHRGNSIVIQVTDDGKGLDPNRIRRKALEKGLITEADAEKMTSHQIYQLVWEPGLSTAQKVTEVSGRGMGMDIVKSKIEELNGVVDLDSEPGKGTTLTIKLPLTLAILPSLMVEIDDDILAMPLESVVEIVSVDRKDLSTVHGQWTARVRGRVISMVRLDEVLAWNRGCDRSHRGDRQETTLVVVGEEGREIGLVVDEVLGEEDIVIKSMAENYRNVAGIAGASILGDGRVSLILDLAALIDMSSSNQTATTVS